MIITLTPLPTISDDIKSKTKFILLEDGKLLYGICKYHKDLGAAYYENQDGDDVIKVIGAGVVPDDVRTGIGDSAWGGWESTGYDIVTPHYMRTIIQEAFIDAFLATS